MSVPKGNCIIAQSGGLTAVINASVSGVVEEAKKYAAITGVYGALNGIRSVLLEEIFDLPKEPPRNISALHRTPARQFTPQVGIEVAADGLPVYVRLEKQMLKKKTPAYELK